MDLTQTAAYSTLGLDADSRRKLATLGDLIREAQLNITGIKEPEDIERLHFLDSLSLLQIEAVASAERLADVGSGGGMPALVLAVAMPGALITAVESQRKKCDFITGAAKSLGLNNVRVCCVRAEEHARSDCREAYDIVTSRAIASLPVVAEYSVPLLRLGGSMVAMKGIVSDQERSQASLALGILGADGLEVIRLDPCPGVRDHLAYVAKKVRMTPSAYPRRPGMPRKRPLGQQGKVRTEEARP